jgi:hypothetical protein
MGHTCVSLFGKNIGLQIETINEMERMLKHYTDLACKDPNFTFFYTCSEDYTEQGRYATINMYAEGNGWRYKSTLGAYNKLAPEFLTPILSHVGYMLESHP